MKQITQFFLEGESPTLSTYFTNNMLKTISFIVGCIKSARTKNLSLKTGQKLNNLDFKSFIETPPSSISHQQVNSDGITWNVSKSEDLWILNQSHLSWGKGWILQYKQMLLRFLVLPLAWDLFYIGLNTWACQSQ